MKITETTIEAVRWTAERDLRMQAETGAPATSYVAAELVIALLAERDERKRDLADWRKGVELIAAAIRKTDGKDRGLSCASIAEGVLELAAKAERLCLEMGPLAMRIAEADALLRRWMRRAEPWTLRHDTQRFLAGSTPDPRSEGEVPR